MGNTDLINPEEFFEIPLWRLLWVQNLTYIIIFSIFLVLIIGAMVFKDRLTKKSAILNIVKYGLLSISFLYAGVVLKAQPATTNIIIVVNALTELQFPLGLYLMEPFIFLSFGFILLTLILWGRGVFCGWLCPYGAMLELLNRLYEKISPKFRINIPESAHWRLVYLKYLIFFVIFAASFYSFILSEYLTEVEPFKTFVLRLNREWYFLAYFVMLTAGSMVIYRAFCRYICPLGAILAVPSFLIKKLPLIKLKRYDLCGTCKICEKRCRPQAVMSDGLINSSECLQCLECQVNFRDEDLCPVLIREKNCSGAKVNITELKIRKQHLSYIQYSVRYTPRFALAIVMLAGSTLLFPPPAYSALRTPHSALQVTLVVGTDYPAIGDALKKAKDGDIIEIRSGEYRERLRIEKAVYLKGIDFPVITGEEGHIIEITSPGVTVDGFIIKNENTLPDIQGAGIYISRGADGTVIKGNRFYRVAHGIWSVGARGIKIENNTIEGKKELDRNSRGNCIYLTDSQGAIITGNKVNYCRDGIYMEVSHDGKVTGNDIRNSRYAVHTMWVDRSVFAQNSASGNLVGLAIMYSRQSTITGNVAAGNQTHGLLFIQTTRSNIEGNTVTGNTKGIFFSNSILNNLSSNLIMNNSLGLHSLGGSEENVITKNSFIGNEIQVKFVAGRDQQWDGNYWSDYLGWDMAGDGAGDLPYESNTVVDHILSKYPSAKLLYASLSLQLLWMLEKQFPLIRVPKVQDTKPSMIPLHSDWKELKAKYPYVSEKYYGEMEKHSIVHGQGH